MSGVSSQKSTPKGGQVVASSQGSSIEKNTGQNKVAQDKVNYTVDLRELLEAGAHFGHQSRRWNPKMEPYIYTQRDGVHVFDLEISAKKLVEAMEFVREWVKNGKEIVFVGTKRQAQEIVKEAALKLNAPYVTERWLGGTLTNWDEISKRIARLKELKAKREEGGFKHYTKREVVLIDREIARLERFFGGLEMFDKRPEAIFVVDTVREDTAVAEAKMVKAPVVGVCDSNGDPDDIEYIIPVNDDAVRTIKLVVEHIARAYEDGKALRGKGQGSEGTQGNKAAK